MNEYNVSDYGIFNNAVGTVDGLSKVLSTVKDEISTCSQQLGNESIFMGPISEQAVEGCTTASSRADSLSTNCSTIKSYLVETSTNYQSGDSKAQLKVLSTGANGEFGTSTSSANFSGDTNQDKLYSYLSSQGFNNAAICGILANIESESGFSTTALGDGGTSYGICQWHEGRWNSLKDYCSENNLDSDSLEGQAQYLVSELKNSYPDVYETLQNVPNTAEGAYQAAYKWTTDFEIPADKYSEGENRGDNAQTTYWEKYGSK